MKKAVIILSLFVLLLGGCKQKSTPENSMPPQADTLHVPQTETQRNATKYDRIDEFNANPPVSAEEIVAIAPIIKK